MSDPNPTREELIYRLVVVSADSRLVLVELDGAELKLPRVAIPRWTRPAAEIQKAARTRWGLHILVLDFLYGSEGSPSCAIAQLLSPGFPEELALVALDGLPESEIGTSECATIEMICTGDTADRGPFSRFDWIDEAVAWIREEVGHEVRFTGEIDQHNAGGTFVLARFATQDGPAYWLKATGEPNLHEFDITAILATICPEYLPPLVAMRRDWNAWVTEEAGEPLSHEIGVSVLEHVIVSMVKLQQKTIGNTERLLAAGAADQRMAVLREHVGEVMAYLEEAMEHQTSTRVPRIEAQRLREIGAIVEDACSAMEELGIPETVIHNDIKHGNILVNQGGCIFTDWCEAYVGNPLVTFQHLLLLSRNDGCTDLDIFRFKKAYQQYWRDFLSPCTIDQAFSLMPLLAVTSCLYGRGTWLQSTERYDPHIRSYSRSLARYMDRAAELISMGETLCH